MALADIVSRTRSILYGTGLGEKPALRIANSNANETVSGSLLTIAMATGEGNKIKPGNVLSALTTTRTDAHAIYVTSIATDAVTGVNGYLGSPAVVGANSGDVDNFLFEQNPLVTSFEIFEAIDTIFAHFLWPYVYDVTTATVATPNLVDGQEAVSAVVDEIINAWQIRGGTAIRVPFQRFPEEVHTSIKSTGRLAQFDWLDGGTGYYTHKEKFTEADDAGDELTHMVAMGAAALCLGSHVVETTFQGTKQDNEEAVSQRVQVGNLLWRDFLTIRQGHSETLGRRGSANTIIVNRG